MKRYPELPFVEEKPEVVSSGHLWILERVAGAHLRFTLDENSVLQFGGREGTFGPAPSVPKSYSYATSSIQERFDREALRAAIDDVAAVTFFGQCMHRTHIDYNWADTPVFLGHDIWDGNRERFLPPDAVDTVFETLGLDAVPVIDREVRARDFDPADPPFPLSAYADEPVSGIVVRNKRGGHALAKRAVENPKSANQLEPPTPEDLATEYARPASLASHATVLEEASLPVSLERLMDRVLQRISRAEHPWLFGDHTAVDQGALREALTPRIRQFLAER